MSLQKQSGDPTQILYVIAIILIIANPGFIILFGILYVGYKIFFDTVEQKEQFGKKYPGFSEFLDVMKSSVSGTTTSTSSNTRIKRQKNRAMKTENSTEYADKKVDELQLLIEQYTPKPGVGLSKEEQVQQKETSQKMLQNMKVKAKKKNIQETNKYSSTSSLLNTKSKSIWDDYESVIDIMEKNKKK